MFCKEEVSEGIRGRKWKFKHRQCWIWISSCDFKRDLRFSPPLCNYSYSPSMWDLMFSSVSQLEASVRKGLCSRFRLGEIELRIKEILTSNTRMCLDLVSIQPDVGCTKCSQLAFLSVMPLWFFRFMLSCFIVLSL
jgi:hypothetical protein